MSKIQSYISPLEKAPNLQVVFDLCTRAFEVLVLHHTVSQLAVSSTILL